MLPARNCFDADEQGNGADERGEFDNAPSRINQVQGWECVLVRLGWRFRLS
jgi:hypothetical protein